jgi:PIN domain nuclease of toxin-antitoxin system
MADSFVTDTHPLIFYAGGLKNRLGPKALRALEGFDAGKVTLYVPAPVVLETWLPARGGKLKMKTSLGAWWRDFEAAGLVREPLQGEDVLAASELDWTHNDVYDRMIVATARRLGLPLITGDSEIIEWGGVPIHWD